MILLCYNSIWLKIPYFHVLCSMFHIFNKKWNEKWKANNLLAVHLSYFHILEDAETLTRSLARRFLTGWPLCHSSHPRLCTLRWIKTPAELIHYSRSQGMPVLIPLCHPRQPERTCYACVTLAHCPCRRATRALVYHTPLTPAEVSKPAVRVTTWYPVTLEPPLLGEVPTLCMTQLVSWTAVKSPPMMTTGWQNLILNFTPHRKHPNYTSTACRHPSTNHYSFLQMVNYVVNINICGRLVSDIFCLMRLIRVVCFIAVNCRHITCPKMWFCAIHDLQYQWRVNLAFYLQSPHLSVLPLMVHIHDAVGDYHFNSYTHYAFLLNLSIWRKTSAVIVFTVTLTGTCKLWKLLISANVFQGPCSDGRE